MLKKDKIMVRPDQIVTSESDVRFLVFENESARNKVRISEVFYDSGNIILKNRELGIDMQERINDNLSKGICEGRMSYIQDFKIDRGSYFGYVVENPVKKSEITCKTVIYDRAAIAKLQNRHITISKVDEVANDTFCITTIDNKTYIVKYLRAKNVEFGILDYCVIPTVGKRCSISVLDLSGNRPLELYKTTSKLLKVKEKDDVYICDTEKTRYIILKERKNNIFGICCYEPCLDQRLRCHSMGFMAAKPYLSQFVTGIVLKVKRLGHVYVVSTNSETFYLEARFRLI